MQRERLARAFFWSLVWGAAGCARTPTEPVLPPLEHVGVEVRVACPKGPAALVREYGRAWAAREGARVEVLPYDPKAGPESAGPADVWVIPPAQLPRWAAAGRLAALPEAYRAPGGAYQWTGLLPMYREQLLVWDRAVYGLPLLGESPLCCYRSDLFADPRHQKAFRAKYGRELEAPATWEQFAAVAEYFHEHGPSGKPGPSLPPLPADDGALDREFYAVAAGLARRAVPADEAAGQDHLDEVFSFHYDLQSGRPRIASPGFVHALKVLRQLQRFRPPGVHAAPEEAFRDGQAVLCLTDASWLPAFQKAPGLRDRFGVCRVPGAGRWFDYRTGKERPAPEGNWVPYLGDRSLLAVVPQDAAHARAAWDLLASLTGPGDRSQITLEPRSGGGPVREQQLNRERWDAFDLDLARTRALRETLQQTLLHRGLKNPVLRLRTPDEAAHRAALVAEVRAALDHGSDPQKALDAVARRWVQLDEARGLERHRAEYRISLGLLPQ
jgi:multiple sugar transport system substrate-binding protein